MIKYVSHAITFAEVPDEISLTLAVSNCGGHCPGCHSPELRQDIGRDLETDLPDLIKKYRDQITCVCFLGQGNDIDALNECIAYCHYHGLNSCLYTGRDSFDVFQTPYLTYLKVGPYDEKLGGVDKVTTNQKMYQFYWAPDISASMMVTRYDITHKFWRKPVV